MSFGYLHFNTKVILLDDVSEGDMSDLLNLSHMAVRLVGTDYPQPSITVSCSLVTLSAGLSETVHPIAPRHVMTEILAMYMIIIHVLTNV